MLKEQYDQNQEVATIEGRQLSEKEKLAGSIVVSLENLRQVAASGSLPDQQELLHKLSELMDEVRVMQIGGYKEFYGNIEALYQIAEEMPEMRPEVNAILCALMQMNVAGGEIEGFLRGRGLIFCLSRLDTENLTGWMEKAIDEIIVKEDLTFSNQLIFSTTLYDQMQAEDNNNLVDFKRLFLLKINERLSRDPFSKNNIVLKNLHYAMTDDMRDHPLYYGQDEKFFEQKGETTTPARRKFSKDGSRLMLLGGSLVGKTVIRTISAEAMKSWKRAYESKEFWEQEGFDYVPVENIYDNRGKLRYHPVQDEAEEKEFERLGIKMEPFEYGYYRCACRVHKMPLMTYLIKHSDQLEWLHKEMHRLEDCLKKLDIIHGHLHAGNFCVEEDPAQGNPRLYIIDFDQAVDIGEFPEHFKRIAKDNTPEA